MTTQTPIPENTAGTQSVNVYEVFWSRVEKTETCWLWKGGVTSAGYGLTTVAPRVLAHRFAYEHQVGPIPEGLQLDHLCRVRLCVRPDHLEPVDNRTNSLRGTSRSAINARAESCPTGHPYDLINTYFNKKGQRFCRTCAREWARERGAEAAVLGLTVREYNRLLKQGVLTRRRAA